MDGTFPQSHFLNLALRGKTSEGAQDPWGGFFFDHNLLLPYKVHIKLFLMRGQTLF